MSPTLLSPGDQVERYVVESVLGRGGMATVYRVTHAELGSFHALKVLHLPDPRWGTRVIREGQAQARLRHPNVVAVTDILRIKDAPALVMEYVGGPTLLRLTSGVQLSLPQIDAVAVGMMDGVAAAHAAGFVHRDLKPDNVLMDIQGDRLVPRIADFGLVRAADGESLGPRATRTNITMGTPAYMSPEQFQDAHNADAISDVFALGASLYYLLTGRDAFVDDDRKLQLGQLYSGTYTSIYRSQPDAPAAWEKAIHAALRPDRAERAKSVAEVRELWRQAGMLAHVEDLWPPAVLDQVLSLGPGLPPVRPTPTRPSNPPSEGMEPPPGHGTLSPDTGPLQHEESVDEPPSVVPNEATDDPASASLETMPFQDLPGTGAGPADRDSVALPQAVPTGPVPDFAESPAEPGRGRMMWVLVPLALLLLAGVGAAIYTGKEAPTAPSESAAAAAPAGTGRVEAATVTPKPAAVPGAEDTEKASDATGSAAPGTGRDAPPKAEATPASTRTTPAATGTGADAADQTPAAPQVEEPEDAPAPAAEAAVATTPAGYTARITVAGSSRAYLIGPRGEKFKPGPVPPGTYSLWVFFDAGDATPAGDYTVVAGQSVRLTCNEGLRVCS